MFAFGRDDSSVFSEKRKLLKRFSIIYVYAVCRMLQKINKELTFISNNSNSEGSLLKKPGPIYSGSAF